jgi:DNA polymerase-3 subunit chi
VRHVTQIDFYTGVADKLGTACRIVAKGYSLKHRIVVFCPDAETAQRIDRLLWTTPATGFVPHCSPADPLAAVTPVIVDHRGDEPVHDQVLVNLRDERPAFFGRFERLIEIVSIDETDRQNARERYRFYRDRGYDIRRHDLAEAPQGRPEAA